MLAYTKKTRMFTIKLYMYMVYYTSIKIIKNEVGCRDDTMSKTVDIRRHARRIESMQQSSATPQNRDVGIGLRKIVACSHSSSRAFLYLQFLAWCRHYILLHFYTCFFYPDLALTAARGELILPVHSTCYCTCTYVCAWVLCARIKTKVVTYTCNQDKMTLV